MTTRTISAGLLAAYQDRDGAAMIVRACEVGSNKYVCFHREVTYSGSPYSPMDLTVRQLLMKPGASRCEIEFDNTENESLNWTRGDDVVIYEWLLDENHEVSDSQTLWTGQVDSWDPGERSAVIVSLPNVGLANRGTPRYTATCIRLFGGPTCRYDGPRLPTGSAPRGCDKSSVDCKTMVLAADFTGTGSDDLTSGGDHTVSTQVWYRIQITSTAPDNYEVYKNTTGAAGPWSTLVQAATPIPGTSPITLPDSSGVTITFASTTGHTGSEEWVIQAGNGIAFCGFRFMPQAGQTVKIGGRPNTVIGSPGTRPWDSNFQKEGYLVDLQPGDSRRDQSRDTDNSTSRGDDPEFGEGGAGPGFEQGGGA